MVLLCLRPVAWWSSICACAIAYCLISIPWMWRRTKKGYLLFNSHYHYPNEEEACEAKNQYFLAVNSWWCHQCCRIRSFIVLLWAFGSVTAFGTISSMIGSKWKKRKLTVFVFSQDIPVFCMEPSSLWIPNWRYRREPSRNADQYSSQVTIVLCNSISEGQCWKLRA